MHNQVPFKNFEHLNQNPDWMQSCLYFACYLSYATIPYYRLVKGIVVRLHRILGLLLLAAPASMASPWIGTNDESLHQDLTTLVEFQVIDAVAISYPVPWRGIDRQLTAIEVHSLPEPAKRAARRLLHYLKHRQADGLYQMTSLNIASDPVRFESVAGSYGQKEQLSHQVEVVSGRWSAKLSANMIDEGELNLDNSYVAMHVGGWVLKAGATDQFWGPANDSSLMLSTNARPIPTVGLFRGSAVESESPWLSWLGPWYASAEIGQFRDPRDVDGAKLWRARFTAKPLKGLTLGMSWAAMWGGAGQPDSLGDLLDVLTFQTQCIDDLPTCDEELNTTTGNHLAGFDLSYSFMLLQRPVTLYAQRIGEDAKDYKVTDNANLFGISTYLGPLKFYMESSDTNIACNGDGNPATNCFYEHSTYTSGYRHYRRAVGSSYDSDADQTTVGVQWRGESGQSAMLKLAQIELNPDGLKPSPVLTDGVSEDIKLVSGYYQQPLGNFLIKVGAEYQDRELGDRQESDVAVFVDLRYVWL
ncbi:capsule assembly Wzi family protein [Alteromonas ponticola]|uniref:Capsule assembly Wzi family protein n=1 Tax=Alteromonas aquimaris TaxID=2998417 RepID=A0ABT3PAY6_9ALTE|nr:capsule assembly Wzi family protein [Alteromonas aquimaris]MCW8109947.1 capsule assembly Wzi family protein [Alteromonas aquimaris]